MTSDTSYGACGALPSASTIADAAARGATLPEAYAMSKAYIEGRRRLDALGADRPEGAKEWSPVPITKSVLTWRIESYGT